MVAAVTDALADRLLAARVVLSAVHLASIIPATVSARLGVFVARIGIAVYGCYRLLTG